MTDFLVLPLSLILLIVSLYNLILMFVFNNWVLKIPENLTVCSCELAS